MRINILRRFLKEQSFKPGLIALFTNPFYFARLGLYKYISKFVRELDGHVLDVGCGTKPYENLFSGESYTGLEIDSDYSRTHSKADFFMMAKSFHSTLKVLTEFFVIRFLSMYLTQTIL